MSKTKCVFAIKNDLEYAYDRKNIVYSNLEAAFTEIDSIVRKLQAEADEIQSIHQKFHMMSTVADCRLLFETKTVFLVPVVSLQYSNYYGDQDFISVQKLIVED